MSAEHWLGRPEPIITYTLFPDTSPVTCQERADVPWRELVAKIHDAPTYVSKRHCPLISLAAYGDRVTDKDCLRHAANVLRVHGVEIDYDGEEVTPEEGAERLRSAGLRSVIYTSPSHVDGAPRWRALLPLSEAALPEMRVHYCARANRALGGIATRESFTLSQSFYIGRVRGATYRVLEIEGREVDLAVDLEPLYFSGYGDGASPHDLRSDEELRETFAAGTGRYEAMLKLSSRWAARGLAYDDIVSALSALLATGNSHNADGIDLNSRIEPLARSAVQKFGRRDAPPPAPVASPAPNGHDARETPPPPATPKGIRVTWAKQYSELTPPRFIIGNLIEAGSLALIFGESNTGKSTFAIDLAITCCRGIPWRGRRTRKAVVAYLPLEGTRGVRQRVRAKVLHDDIPEELPFADLTGHINLLQDASLISLLSVMREVHAVESGSELLLIIDTVARAMAGGDENSSYDMGAMIGACDVLRRELACTIFLVHHAGKDSTKGARGHSSLRAAVDTEIEVTGTVNPRVVTVRKQRDLPSGETFAFDLEPVELGKDPETYDPVAACVAVYRGESVATMAAESKSPTGKAQRQLLAGLRNLQKDAGAEQIWTLQDIRSIGRTGGLSKDTARKAAEALTLSGYLRPSVGGYMLPKNDV